MKVLWLSMNDGLLKSSDTSGYNGIGWIASLQSLVEDTDNMLGLAYISETDTISRKVGKTLYFPVYRRPRTPFQKLKEYYGGYRHWDREEYVSQVQAIIAQFHPDVIHLFGMENDLATVLGRTDVPVIAHLQGLLGPCVNAFFPPAMNIFSLLNPPTLKEWVLRNGSIYAFNSMKVRADREAELFKSTKFFMGRTGWDHDVSRLMSPDSRYFTINEILRTTFYRRAGQWIPPVGRFTIVSTLSPVAYKGFDVILKTAWLLKRESDIDFRWNVIGLSGCMGIVRIFEKLCGIKASSVNVHCTGILDEESLAGELLKSNVYVHPSYIDNSSNSLCEAQMLGMPVIATFAGGTPSLIRDGETGFLVPINDIYGLAYKLVQLAVDTSLWQNVGHNAFLDARKRHDRKDIIKSLIETYNKVVLIDTIGDRCQSGD